MVGIELLLTLIVVLLAWMRVSAATQERAFEFEQRLQNYFAVKSKGEVQIMNNFSEDIGVTVQNVTFHESDDLGYLLRKSFWPWQEIDGKVVFDIITQGFTIQDTEEFTQRLGDQQKISSCTHEGHSDHYFVKIMSKPEEPEFNRMANLEMVLYFIANSKEVADTEEDDSSGQ